MALARDLLPRLGAKLLGKLRFHKNSLIQSRPVAAWITSLFHQLYYGLDKRTWRDTRWLGVNVLKCPLDLWIYQELLFRVRPDAIIECGTAQGGSAFYFASLLDLIGKGRVITVDVDDCPRPEHRRISYVHGSSTDPDVFARVRSMLAPGDTVLVVLDSDHSKAHVLAEMTLYAPLVSTGSYLCVEDSNLNGHPVAPHVGAGPGEAIGEFLSRNPQFEVDRGCEKFFLTFSPGGYLQRVG